MDKTPAFTCYVEYSKFAFCNLHDIGSIVRVKRVARFTKKISILEALLLKQGIFKNTDLCVVGL